MWWRTAKSCGPDSPTLESSLAVWRCRPFGRDTPDSQGDGGYQARHTRESAKQPLKPLRRECRLSRPNLW
jgi:hypothetical protein